MSLQRVTRKFASPTTNQPFSSNVQAQLQRAVVHKNLLLHASRYWVTHSQAVRLCGTRPKKGSVSTKVKVYSETVVPFESIEASQRKALLSTTPPYFGLGVGIFVEGRWKQINRPLSLLAQLNPTMADRRLYIDTNTAIDLGLLAGKVPKNAVAIKSDSRLRLYHASQLESPERCVPPEGLAVNPSTGRRWTQPAHDVLVAAGVLMGYVSPMWLTSKQAEMHFGVRIVKERNTVTTHLREGTAVQWKLLPTSAKTALAAGCHMVIGAGAPEHALARLVDGAPCTWFVATATPMTARKQWIAGSLRPAGNLTIDDGAWAALRAGKSLLPAGVTEVEGRFGRGDAVVVRDGAGAEVARGLSAYAADDARRIKGHKSREIERILGYRGRDEMIHRDDLVLLKGA